MRKLFVSSLLCTVGLLPSAVLAQLSVPKVEVGVFGQYTKLDSKVKIDNPIALGAQLSFPLYKWLGVEGNAQYGATKSNITPFGSVKYSPLHAFATLSVPVASKAALILGGGGGVSIYKGHRTGNESEEHGSALVGLKLCGSGKWGARIDGVGDFTPLPDDYPPYGKSSNWGGRIGVTYALHGACAASAKKFDWKLAAAGAAAPLARGASRQVALSAADDDTHPIEVRKVNNLVCSSSDPNVATVDNSGNVKAVRYGTATITCKGLVKDIDNETNLTKTGRGLGTPNFMAPEQFRNAKNADVRCDIYSLGATLYAMVTGETPFGNSNGRLARETRRD